MMKKIIKIVILLGILVLLTGCGKYNEVCMSKTGQEICENYNLIYEEVDYINPVTADCYNEESNKYDYREIGNKGYEEVRLKFKPSELRACEK